MSTIVIIIHQYDELSRFRIRPLERRSKYLLYQILRELKRRSHRIVVSSGVPDKRAQGDVAMLHVNTTIVPIEYVDYAKSFPFCVNLGATDISKKAISGAVLNKGEAWGGQVIVKSNLNFRGVPEIRFNHVAKRKGHPPPFPHAKLYDYQIYDSIFDLPEGVFEDDDVIVDRFIPEREGKDYAGRFWIFCGNHERCNRYVSAEQLLKGSNVIRNDPVEVPDELRIVRRRLGLDYGKFDFVVHEGKTFLLDANKTLGYSYHLRDRLQSEIYKFADGFEQMISENV